MAHKQIMDLTFDKIKRADNLILLKGLDKDTLNHSLNVAELSVLLGVAAGLSEDEIYNLYLGALFHDIGKSFIPKGILNKKGRLSKEEMDIMKTHSRLGYDYMKANSNLPQTSLNIILHHHERLDGLGYPANKHNSELSAKIKIVSVCDVYDALVSERAYKDAMSTEKAIKILNEGRGIQFDGQLIDLLEKQVLSKLYDMSDDKASYPA